MATGEPSTTFTQIDLPAARPGIRWQAQLFDPVAGAFGHTPYPQAIAWLSDYSDSELACVMLDFVLVPDQFRRCGYATKLIAACEARWPNLELTEAISEAGEGLLGALEGIDE
jgi:hypothetical protein